MATCSNILAWRIPRTEELGVLMGYKQSYMTSRLSMHTHILLDRNAMVILGPSKDELGKKHKPESAQYYWHQPETESYCMTFHFGWP